MYNGIPPFRFYSLIRLRSLAIFFSLIRYEGKVFVHKSIYPLSVYSLLVYILPLCGERQQIWSSFAVILDFLSNYLVVSGSCSIFVQLLCHHKRSFTDMTLLRTPSNTYFLLEWRQNRWLHVTYL